MPGGGAGDAFAGSCWSRPRQCNANQGYQACSVFQDVDGCRQSPHTMYLGSSIGGPLHLPSLLVGCVKLLEVNLHKSGPHGFSTPLSVTAVVTVTLHAVSAPPAACRTPALLAAALRRSQRRTVSNCSPGRLATQRAEQQPWCLWSTEQAVAVNASPLDRQLGPKLCKSVTGVGRRKRCTCLQRQAHSLLPHTSRLSSGRWSLILSRPGQATRHQRSTMGGLRATARESGLRLPPPATS